jgi:hypothetical protein
MPCSETLTVITRLFQSQRCFSKRGTRIFSSEGLTLVRKKGRRGPEASAVVDRAAFAWWMRGFVLILEYSIYVCALAETALCMHGAVFLQQHYRYVYIFFLPCCIPGSCTHNSAGRV